MPHSASARVRVLLDSRPDSRPLVATVSQALTSSEPRRLRKSSSRLVTVELEENAHTSADLASARPPRAAECGCTEQVDPSAPAARAKLTHAEMSKLFVRISMHVQNTHSSSLDLLAHRSAAFSIVVVGNQIVELLIRLPACR